MATVSNQSVQTSNRIYIMAQKNLIGRAQSLTANRQYGTEGVYEIGSIMPHEHVYLKYTGTLTLERFRTVGDSLSSKKIDLARLGSDILTKDVVTIAVIDSVTRGVLEAFYGCSAQSYSTSYRANSIVTENISFFYLDSGVNLNSGN